MEEKKDIYILGIESSCDDTSAAVLRNGVLLSTPSLCVRWRCRA